MTVDKRFKAPGSASILALISAIGASAPAAAQEEGDIVVTAQRREQSLLEVPVSASVLSGDSLARNNITSLADLGSQAASVNITQGAASDQIQVRGIGSGYNAGFEQSVATFLDGAYRPRARSTRLALFDIERLEVLKGPQTIYFGANAIAGALNITSRKPSSTPQANMTALYAVPDGEYNIEGGFSLPVFDDLSVRVAGRISGMHGYIKNVRYDTWGPNLDDKQGRVSLHYGHGAFTFDARYDIARSRDKGNLEGELVGCPSTIIVPQGQCARALSLYSPIDDRLDRRSETGTRSFSNIDLDELVGVGRLDLGALTLVSTTGYQHQNATLRTTVAPYPGLSALGVPDYLPYQTDERFRQFSQELRIQSNGDGPFEYIFGGYYEDNRLNHLTTFGLWFVPFANTPALSSYLPPNTRILSRTFSDQTSRTLSGFAALTWNLSKAFSVTAGLRYSNVRKTGVLTSQFGSGGYFFDDNLPFVPFAGNVQAIAATLHGLPYNRTYADPSRTDDAWMPSFNARYTLAEDVMAYASFTHGFKAGGYAISTTDSFAPEYVNAYELGLKGRFLDRRLTASIALFRSDYDDMQESQTLVLSSGTVIPVIANVASSRSEGVEVSASLRPTAGLTLRSELAYVDSRYTSYPGSPCSVVDTALLPAGTPCVKDASGQRRTYAPKWAGSVGADYERDVAGGLRLTLGSTVYFTSRFYTQPIISDVVVQPGFAKWDARIGLGSADRRWQVALIGRNLTDKLTASYRNYASGGAGTTAAFADRGRSVAAQLGMNW